MEKEYGWKWFCVEENRDDCFDCVGCNKEGGWWGCDEYI